MLIRRLILSGVAAAGAGIAMLTVGLQMPEYLGEFVWQGPIVSAAGIGLAGYGFWKLPRKK